VQLEEMDGLIIDQLPSGFEICWGWKWWRS